MPFEIISMTEDKDITQARGVQDVYRINFLVNGHGPFHDTILKADFTPDKVKERISKKAKEIESTLMLKG